MRVSFKRRLPMTLTVIISSLLRINMFMGAALMGLYLSGSCVQAYADGGGMYGRIIESLADVMQMLIDENNTTGLADGRYVPDWFGYSGGTGRVTIDCQEVTVREGRAYASLVFDSGSYSYVRADGDVYEGTNTADTSVFEIPVRLNRNNTVTGCTTKMSSAHEIAYSIFIYIGEADGGASKRTDGDTPALSNTGEWSGTELSKEAPQIANLAFERETAAEHAEFFRIFHYEGGLTLIETDSGTDPDAGAEEGTEESGTEPYHKRIIRYLIVPDQAEIPAGLDKEMVIIRRPGKTEGEERFHAYAASVPVLEGMKELGQLHSLALTGMTEEECRIPEIRRLLKEKKVTFGGTYDDIEYKALVAGKCDLALMPAELLPPGRSMEGTEDPSEESYKTYREISGYMGELGIPVFIDLSAMEESFGAQAEWIKVYGALFGCEEKAQELYLTRQEAVK